MPPQTHSMLTALKAEAQRIRSHQKALGDHPLNVKARCWCSWVESRPDLAPVIPIDELDTSKVQPAGQRVLVDGQEWFLRMRLTNYDCGFWVTRPPRAEQLTKVNPLDGFPLDGPPDRLLECCQMVALLQSAAGGNPDELQQVLWMAGFDEAARFVAKHDNGYEPWDEVAVPRSFPSPRKFLEAALAGPGREWHRWVLEHLCEGGEDWEQGENPVPVPTANSAMPDPT